MPTRTDLLKVLHRSLVVLDSKRWVLLDLSDDKELDGGMSDILSPDEP